nr:ABC transporter B family member 11-like [Tanacetum cinerariifolium]
MNARSTSRDYSREHDGDDSGYIKVEKTVGKAVHGGEDDGGSSILSLVIADGIMSVTIAKMAPHGKDAYAKASIVVEQTGGSIRMVASFTKEKKAVKEYNKSLVDAYNTSVHEGLATGLGLGAMMLIVLCSYSLAVWYGTNMIIEKGYNEGTVHTNKNLKKKANKDLESLVKREGTDNPKSLGAIASVDSKMMVLSLATTINEKSSILSTNETDQIVSSDNRKRNPRVKKIVAGVVLSAKVDAVASGESVKGKIVIDDTTPNKKKKKINKKKKKVASDILSAKVDEIVSCETVSDKAITDNTTPKMKKMKVEGDVLSTEVHQVVSGETVPSKTATINTTPKKKKRNKKKRKLKTVVGAGSMTSSAQMAAKRTTSHPKTTAISRVGSLASVRNISEAFNVTSPHVKKEADKTMREKFSKIDMLTVKFD